jgi:hypothetical protein
VVQHAPVSVIEPFFEKKFVKETFARIAGRGTHAAMRHTLHCCRAIKRNWGAYYTLKCSVSGFFPGVNHDILKKIPRRSISDPSVLNLFAVIIDSYDTDGRGIPTGSLTGRLAANMYLDPRIILLKRSAAQRITYDIWMILLFYITTRRISRNCGRILKPLFATNLTLI